MLATLKIEGKEFQIEISDPELQKILVGKKTGYERAKLGERYYLDNSLGEVLDYSEHGDDFDKSYFSYANYYTDETLAKNVAKADKLMRQLRRFSVEHREKKIDWIGITNPKYYIEYDHTEKDFMISEDRFIHHFGAIYFDTQNHCSEAIQNFKDELIWYFTEYKDTVEI